jgi:hypothetical protein
VVDRWIVFGGWATPAAALAPLFGEGAQYLDLNGIVPDLVSNETLRPDWQSVVSERVVRLADHRSFGIAGWSTGAMIAFAAAKNLHPQAAVFLAATPSFCRRPGFPYGQKPSVLRAMREKLAVDPGSVLTDFYSRCGVPGKRHRIYSPSYQWVTLSGTGDVAAGFSPPLPFAVPAWAGGQDRAVSGGRAVLRGGGRSVGGIFRRACIFHGSGAGDCGINRAIFLIKHLSVPYFLTFSKLEALRGCESARGTRA